MVTFLHVTHSNHSDILQ